MDEESKSQTTTYAQQLDEVLGHLEETALAQLENDQPFPILAEAKQIAAEVHKVRELLRNQQHQSSKTDTSNLSQNLEIHFVNRPFWVVKHLAESLGVITPEFTLSQLQQALQSSFQKDTSTDKTIDKETRIPGVQLGINQAPSSINTYTISITPSQTVFDSIRHEEPLKPLQPLFVGNKGTN